MSESCLLENRSHSCNGKCERCGWNPEEATLRAKQLIENGLTKGKKGLERLIIKREESEE